MTDKEDIRNLLKRIALIRANDHWAVSFARDLLWVVMVVGGIALALFLICGTWPAVVTIESSSMDPHMKVGDLVVVVQKDRYGVFETWEDGKKNDYMKYEDYGDVIIYQPNGLTTVHPIIHRAIQFADQQPVTEIKGQKLIGNYTPPHRGYITWGDNNLRPDQLSSYPGIGPIEPVQEEWIIGKALFAVPLVGYLPLNIVPVVIIVLVLMLLHELYLRSRPDKTETTKPQKKRVKKR